MTETATVRRGQAQPGTSTRLTAKNTQNAEATGQAGGIMARADTARDIGQSEVSMLGIYLK